MLAVPHHRQRTAFSCGPASLRIALEYFGVEVPEAEISEAVGCSSEHGSSPGALARYARKRGLIARSRRNLSLADLRADIRAYRVPIVAMQAWGGPGVDLSSSSDHGHYCLVVGVSTDRVTLCDPSAKTKHIHLDPETFLARWHDKCAQGRNYERWALTVRRK